MTEDAFDFDLPIGKYQFRLVYWDTNAHPCERSELPDPLITFRVDNNFDFQQIEIIRLWAKNRYRDS